MIMKWQLVGKYHEMVLLYYMIVNRMLSWYVELGYQMLEKKNWKLLARYEIMVILHYIIDNRIFKLVCRSQREEMPVRFCLLTRKQQSDSDFQCSISKSDFYPSLILPVLVKYKIFILVSFVRISQTFHVSFPTVQGFTIFTDC